MMKNSMILKKKKKIKKSLRRMQRPKSHKRKKILSIPNRMKKKNKELKNQRMIKNPMIL